MSIFNSQQNDINKRLVRYIIQQTVINPTTYHSNKKSLFIKLITQTGIK